MSISSAWERSWRNAQQSAWLVRLSLFVIVFALTAIAWAVPAFSLDPPQVSFRDQIRPILQQHCWACHGGVKKAGDLKLTSESDARGVLESSADEVPELLRRIVTNDVDERMPPPDHGRALHAVEIELIKKWFDEGAVWQGHWAFDPPKRTSLHKDPSSWSRDPLDTWVMSSMPRSQGSFNSDRLIEPSSAESPERWIRRATLSLIGIPPTAEEIDTFVHDENQYGELAYEHAVDQLLASPKFGEHWASVWLDQVRYADSRGLGQDGPRPMWNYRDWVVRSFNQDLPYDEFTRMQLAGDLKPKPEIDDLVATAVHRLTQTNEEGGTDDEEFRVMAVIDRINTTWQVWQGLTFGCAQCHDHPYDPIRQVDFYSFMDFLNNTSDWDLNEEYPLLAVPVDNTFNERAGELDRSIRDVRWQIWNDELPWLVDKNHWISPKSLQVSATKGTEVAINEEQKNEFHTVGTVQRDTSFTMLVPIDRPTKLTAVRLTLRALDPLKAAIDTEVGSIISHIEIQTRPNRDAQWETAKISRVIGDEPEPFINPNESLNPKSNIGFGAYARIQHDRQAAFVLESPISLALGSEIQIRTDHKMFILDSFVLVPRRMSVAINSIEQGISIPRDELLSKLRASLAEMVRERAAIKSVTLPIVRDLPPNLHRSTHLFIRGLFLTKDQQVHANLPVWATEHSISPDDRVGLAEWMVHENNTLTSRVHVNRLWSRVFGSGLVVSEEDFGSSGELPSHPELLDELAVRFQRDYRWSQKKLLRDLILSSTFRQSNRASSEQIASDPSNRWLQRGPRIRLSGEVIRDSALAIADLVDSRIGGPSVHPPIQEGVWRPFQGGDDWKTPEVGKADRYRRSIYTYWKRSIPYPFLVAFDSPTREFCTARRMNSNTPLQPLMTLNDRTFNECATAIAEGLMREFAASEVFEITGGDGARIDTRTSWLWQRILARTPSRDEREMLRDFVRQEARADKKNWNDTSLWSKVVLLLLNHDEFFSN